ncbi:Thyroid hormone receptor-associated protein 3 [Tupaia chinensis]|uniref:Thyroid hormone receptor-associated protein 3 n=1 Tax=Tupaia chinensis TaxID=246437 RepID=L9JCW4_TUPCH|nr:Thyroid hormone receptor-associated protein 3 [Tupaia chinensis]
MPDDSELALVLTHWQPPGKLCVHSLPRLVGRRSVLLTVFSSIVTNENPSDLMLWRHLGWALGREGEDMGKKSHFRASDTGGGERVTKAKRGEASDQTGLHEEAELKSPRLHRSPLPLAVHLRPGDNQGDEAKEQTFPGGTSQDSKVTEISKLWPDAAPMALVLHARPRWKLQDDSEKKMADFHKDDFHQARRRARPGKEAIQAGPILSSGPRGCVVALRLPAAKPVGVAVADWAGRHQHKVAMMIRRGRRPVCPETLTVKPRVRRPPVVPAGKRQSWRESTTVTAVTTLTRFPLSWSHPHRAVIREGGHLASELNLTTTSKPALLPEPRCPDTSSSTAALPSLPQLQDPGASSRRLN